MLAAFVCNTIDVIVFNTAVADGIAVGILAMCLLQLLCVSRACRISVVRVSVSFVCLCFCLVGLCSCAVGFLGFFLSVCRFSEVYYWHLV